MTLISIPCVEGKGCEKGPGPGLCLGMAIHMIARQAAACSSMDAAMPYTTLPCGLPLLNGVCDLHCWLRRLSANAVTGLAQAGLQGLRACRESG